MEWEWGKQRHKAAPSLAGRSLSMVGMRRSRIFESSSPQESFGPDRSESSSPLFVPDYLFSCGDT